MTWAFSEKFNRFPKLLGLGQQGGGGQDVGMFLKQAFRELIADALIHLEDKSIIALKDVA